MKTLVLTSLVALTLAGCQTIDERRADQDRADDARCQEYGARRGTPGYTQCRIDLDRNKAIESANRRPTVVVTQPLWGGGIYSRGPGFCRPTPWGVRCY
jgi:hypothetical protein